MRVMRVFDEKDVLRLLRSEVKRAGSQVAWGKKIGVDRTDAIIESRLITTRQMVNLGGPVEFATATEQQARERESSIFRKIEKIEKVCGPPRV